MGNSKLRCAACSLGAAVVARVLSLLCADVSMAFNELGPVFVMLLLGVGAALEPLVSPDETPEDLAPELGTNLNTCIVEVPEVPASSLAGVARSAK